MFIYFRLYLQPLEALRDGWRISLHIVILYKTEKNIFLHILIAKNILGQKQNFTDKCRMAVQFLGRFM